MGWTRFLIAAALVPLAVMAVVAPRYIIDPYGVFHPPQTETAKHVNLRYVKQRWLDDHCGDYGGFVFGNSRANGYETAALEEIYGTQFFNMTVPTESWRGIKVRAEWILDHCAPEIFVVPLGPGATRYPFFTEDYARIEPARFTGSSEWRLRADYLRAPMPAVLNNEKAGGRGYSYDPATGHWRYPLSEESRASGRRIPSIEECPLEGQVRNYTPRRYVNQYRVMADLEERAAARGVKIVWIVNPLSAAILRRQGAQLYVDWVDAILKQTGEIVFLGGYNAFTTNSLNYWDNSHFRPSMTGDFLKEAMKSRNDAMNGVWTADHSEELRRALSRNLAERSAKCRALTQQSGGAA